MKKLIKIINKYIYLCIPILQGIFVIALLSLTGKIAQLESYINSNYSNIITISCVFILLNLTIFIFTRVNMQTSYYFKEILKYGHIKIFKRITKIGFIFGMLTIFLTIFEFNYILILISLNVLISEIISSTYYLINVDKYN